MWKFQFAVFYHNLPLEKKNMKFTSHPMLTLELLIPRIKTINRAENYLKNGRLAPAYFSPNYKFFDQFLQTVKNKTTILILVFKGFLQTPIPPLISVLYAKGYHDFPLKNFCLTVPKNSVGEPFSVSLISSIE